MKPFVSAALATYAFAFDFGRLLAGDGEEWGYEINNIIVADPLPGYQYTNSYSAMTIFMAVYLDESSAALLGIQAMEMATMTFEITGEQAWDDGTWIGIYFSIPDIDNPGYLQTANTVVKYSTANTWASDVKIYNYYGQESFAWADLNTGNFQTFVSGDRDPNDPWEIKLDDLQGSYPSTSGLEST